eukprot:scaffold2191_cov92-Skeletonema_marinoi.AAC.15
MICRDNSLSFGGSLHREESLPEKKERKDTNKNATAHHQKAHITQHHSINNKTTAVTTTRGGGIKG